MGCRRRLSRCAMSWRGGAMASKRRPDQRAGVCPACGTRASAAPGATQALADALCALHEAAVGNEAAHAARERRQASAVGAAAAEIAGADHLAVATDIEAGGLRPHL